MDLSPDQAQEQLIAAAQAVIGRDLPLSRLHGAQPLGDGSWRKSLADLGWLGAGLAEDLGGVGMSLAEEALLARELGRGLGPTGFLHASVAIQASAACGRADLTRAMIGGDLAIGLAVAEQPLSIAGSSLGGPLRLYDAHDADLLVLLTPDAARLLEPPSRRSETSCLDKSVSMGSAEARDCRLVATAEGETFAAWQAVLVAAMLCGVAEATRDMINAYARLRETFGRPIGSYQAVRHPIAEMAARCEQTRSLVFYSALAMRDGRPDALAHASAAFLVAKSAALQNSDVNIQLHGGIGVTDDLDAHLYLKRAQVLARWCGSPKPHLKRVLETTLARL